MVTKTLTGTDDEVGDNDDLGEAVATYLFDVALADSLLSSTGLALAACLAALAAVTLVGGGSPISIIAQVALIAVALVAAWGLLVAATRLRRKRDRFVVRQRGLTQHQGPTVTHTRWVDIAAVTQSGSGSASRFARWNGAAFQCRITRRNGGSTVFDNYVVDASTLAHDIESRSLC